MSTVISRDPLSRKERALRDACIARVRTGIAGVASASEALFELRDGRLYRETHRTFEAFCHHTFGLTRRRVNQLIMSGEVLQDLEDANAMPVPNFISDGDFGKSDFPKATENETPGVSFLPQNEGQLVQLGAVPREDRPRVWAASIERAGGKQPTQRIVGQVVGEVLGRPSAVASIDSAGTLIRRALGFLRSLSSPSENVTAAVALLLRELDGGSANPTKKGQINEPK